MTRLILSVGVYVVIIGSLLLQTGCMAMMGIKEIQTAGGTRISGITGVDFSAGVNGVDTVNDKRGISPGGGYAEVREAREKY